MLCNSECIFSVILEQTECTCILEMKARSERRGDTSVKVEMEAVIHGILEGGNRREEGCGWQ